MGVYIKGMSADMVRLLIGNVMLADCELIEVKTPHGDLIDRDRAIDGAKVDGAWAALAYEPTVIESEG